MRVFVTGATGFIGSAVVRDLIGAGHQVLGLTRSDAGAEALVAAGAEVHRGTLEDLDSLRDGAARSDGIIHLAFNHDFSRFVENCEDDRRVVEALAAVIAGSPRPLVVTSGTGMTNAAPGQPAMEDGLPVPSSVIPRAASEEAAMAAVGKGANVSIVRLPQVHDTRRQGLISYAIMVAREKGVSAYVGDGQNRWPAAHVSDVAPLYRLVLERAEPGARYHAVAEEGVTMRAIAEMLGRKLDLPVVSLDPDKAAEHFGWLAAFAGRDLPASSAWTRRALGWHPIGPDMMTDLENLSLEG
jgi:nucleoside-diphosphate-sugar epimerase